MSYIGKEVTIYFEALGSKGLFTGKCVSANEVVVDIVRDGRNIGEYEGVTIPWNTIRYITYRAERPR